MVPEVKSTALTLQWEYTKHWEYNENDLSFPSLWKITDMHLFPRNISFFIDPSFWIYLWNPGHIFNVPVYQIKQMQKKYLVLLTEHWNRNKVCVPPYYYCKPLKWFKRFNYHFLLKSNQSSIWACFLEFQRCCIMAIILTTRQHKVICLPDSMKDEWHPQ